MERQTSVNRLHRLPQFIRFCVVGGIGFALDAGILLGLIHVGGWSPLVARVPSFLCALTVMWVLNNRLTFAAAVPLGVQNFMRYAAANSVGLLCNFAIYTICMLYDVIPFLALIVATAVTLIWNYTTMRVWVFRDKN